MNISLQLLKRILSREKSYIPSFLLLGVIGLAMLPVELYGLFLARKLIDSGFITQSWNVIRQTLWVLVILFVIRSITTYIINLYSTRLQLRINKKFQGELFSHLLRLPMPAVSKEPTGRLMSRLLDDATRFATIFDQMFGGAILDPLKLVVLILLLAYFSVRLCILMTVSTLLSMLVIHIMGNKLHIISKHIQNKNATLYTFVEQTLYNIELIKSKAAEKITGQEFHLRLDELIQYALKMLSVSLITRPILQLLKFFALGSVFFYGSWMISQGELTIGTLTLFLGATYLFFNTLDSVGRTYGLLRENLARLEVLFSMLELPPESAALGPTDRPPIKIGKIEFKNVTFAYSDSMQVLKSVCFTISGEGVYGVTGQSGSGKTTLVRLLMRFFEPDQGSIQFNDRPLQQFDLTRLRAAIGIVFQDNLILNHTIRQNIAYGHPNLTDREILRAAKLAGAHNFIRHLPARYDAVVGESGRNLSGGERQRIAIARALVTNPDLLILDEGTSFLEVDQEEMILQKIKAHRQDKITIIISHRLSAMQMVDRILTLDNGRVVETDFRSLAVIQ